jgi:hypothetical protein
MDSRRNRSPCARCHPARRPPRTSAERERVRARVGDESRSRCVPRQRVPSPDRRRGCPRSRPGRETRRGGNAAVRRIHDARGRRSPDPLRRR